MVISELSKFIKEHRLSKGLSKRKLAELANISHTEIHRLENGERKNPSPPILKSIAIALNVTYDEIMQAAGYMDSTSPVTVIAARSDDLSDLTELEYEQVRSYIDFIRSKHD
jgi:transcriptional regulator with XRE-family HTH domain